MLSDITIGQFFPGNSIIHRLDARVKIILLTAIIILIFVTYNFVSLAVAAFAVLAVVLLTKVPLRLYIKGMKAIIFIVLFTSILNLLYGQGDPIWQFGFLKITWSGINNAVFVTIRIFALILISCVLTYTTSPTDLTDALERIMKPLKIFHIKVHEIAMMMTIALRFIPTLLEETEKIMNAQKARGADMESGGFVKKIKALIPILIPLFISAFRRAYDLAVAMECRCYRGGDGRTKMKIMHAGKTDALAVVFCCLLYAGVILCNIFLPTTIR